MMLRRLLRLSPSAWKRIAVTATHQSVDPVLGFDFEHCARRQVLKEDAAFDLRLDNAPIDLVAQVRIRSKYRGDEVNRVRH